MYKPHVGDKIKFKGYTPEAFQRGGVPLFFEGQGVVMWIDGVFYIRMTDNTIIPTYFCENMELVT